MSVAFAEVIVERRGQADRGDERQHDRDRAGNQRAPYEAAAMLPVFAPEQHLEGLQRRDGGHRTRGGRGLEVVVGGIHA
ncbi:hypothetical protein ACLMLE_10090 [Lysobacter capsici]